MWHYSTYMTIKPFLHGKTVLVTGGTGTFGRAFVARVLKDQKPKKVIVFSRDEYKQSLMQREFDDKRLRFFIGDVRDRERLARAFQGVDVVVHAAALKQVPAIEYNPLEAVKTNVTGTQNVIDAALDARVGKVMFISSDKAVQPINLYGATKLCAERLVISANAYSGDALPTRFSVMRYGNVVGSRGSFIELIRERRQKGVIPLTHEEMTRFWIPIDHVIDIILEKIGLMKGGEIFVPKMKAMPVKDVIELLAPECTVEVVGMRPGEKLHEVLITQYEAPRTHELPRAFVIRPEFGSTDTIWLDKVPKVPRGFVFSSDNGDFLLTKKEASLILKL